MKRWLSSLLATVLQFFFEPFYLTNQASSFSNDIEAYIAEKVLPLSHRKLVAYQFGDMSTLPEGRGTTYTASRYVRLPLPQTPLVEGVAPPGAALTLQQVSATAQQWGDRVIITDVAQLTIKHPLFEQAMDLVALEVAETMERNTFNNLMAGTQVNFANAKTSRANLLATDVMTTHEINKVVAALESYGAPSFNGTENLDEEVDADRIKEINSKTNPHYVAIVHNAVAQDLREDSTIKTAWSYSDIEKLYTSEIGQWADIRFCKSNMVPYLVGAAQLGGTPSNSGGSLTNAASPYYIIVTQTDTATGYERTIYQVSAGITIGAGTTGSISVVLPNVAGVTFNVYLGTTTSPTNLATCASGPSTGTLAGLATQLAPNQTVVLTGTSTTGTPWGGPFAAPANGVTVYPTFIFGKHAYAQVKLTNPEFTYLSKADKSDPLNQTRVVGWKVFYGTLLSNQGFFGRVESGSAFATTWYQGQAANS